MDEQGEAARRAVGNPERVGQHPRLGEIAPEQPRHPGKRVIDRRTQHATAHPSHEKRGQADEHVVPPPRHVAKARSARRPH